MSERLRGFLAAFLGLALVLLGLMLLFGAQRELLETQGSLQPKATEMQWTYLPGYTPQPTITPVPPGAYPSEPTPAPIKSPTPPPSPTALPAPVLKAVLVPREILTGDTIAFIKDKNLWLLNVDSQEMAPATASGNVEWNFGWSHDRSKILLGVGKWILPESDAPSGSDLWVINADGTQPLRLTKDLMVAVAMWSPIDDRVAYGTRDGRMHIVNSDGTNYRTLLDDSVSNIYLGPWSPDGSQIAYRESTSGAVHLMVLSLMDGSRRQLASEGSYFVGYLHSFDVQWSLDGQRILFQSREPRPDVWRRIDADGSNLTHLDNESLRSISAYSTWAPRSPAADRVVFSTYDSTSNKNIWTMDFEGQAQEVTRGSFPVWSPRGDRIAYVGEDNGLWVIDVDGSDAKRLTASASQPHWSN